MENKYLVGIDGGTASIRVGVFDLQGHCLAFSVKEYGTDFPKPGWAEQDPDEWWSCLKMATVEALHKSGIDPENILALSVDGTSSTVVCLDKDLKPLRKAILWMDNRSAAQAQKIFDSNHPVLKRSQAGVSAEWMIPKIIWIKENQPEIFDRTQFFMEQADYLTHKLSGEASLSLNHITHRWFYNRREGGWPTDFYSKIGLDGITEKFSKNILELGSVVGNITKEAAELLGLKASTIVAQGGCDAYVGMLGLNATRAGRAALIAGSSHVLMPMTDKDIYIKGIFGVHPDCVISGLSAMEGGQVSSGSIVKWFRDNFAESEIAAAKAKGVDPYSLLTEKASTIPIGSEGLIVLDYWQGNRNPYTDYKVQGAIWGLTLKHKKEHIFRAVLEGVAFGTENILRTLAENGLKVDSIYISGGTAKSDFWLQMHADVSNIPFCTTEFTEATMLGTAICAAVGAECYKDLVEAADNMVRVDRVIEPNEKNHKAYEFYFDKYRKTYFSLRPLMYEMSERPEQ